MTNAIPIPTESQEQQALFQWASMQYGKYPDLRLMYHVANEGLRHPATGNKMRLEGLRAGVPDICLPISKGGYSALYIELKRVKGGRLSDKQREWIEALRAAGNRVEVCKGFDEARTAILEYLEGLDENH